MSESGRMQSLPALAVVVRQNVTGMNPSSVPGAMLTACSIRANFIITEQQSRYALYQKWYPVMWNDSRNNTNLGNRFTILLSFCNGCKLGANRGSVGATPGFPFSLTKLFFTFTTQTCAKSLHLSFDPLAPCYSALCFLLLVSNKSSVFLLLS